MYAIFHFVLYKFSVVVVFILFYCNLEFVLNFVPRIEILVKF